MPLCGNLQHFTNLNDVDLRLRNERCTVMAGKIVRIRSSFVRMRIVASHLCSTWNLYEEFCYVTPAPPIECCCYKLFLYDTPLLPVSVRLLKFLNLLQIFSFQCWFGSGGFIFCLRCLKETITRCLRLAVLCRNLAVAHCSKNFQRSVTISGTHRNAQLNCLTQADLIQNEIRWDK